jgi:type II secretory pathway pseudopilin PulG
MSINGINSSPLLPNLGATRTDAARTSNTGNAGVASQQGLTQARTANALKPQTPIAGQGATQSAVPAEAPAGTDPALWSVLTTEERNFFAKTANLGPLTYSRFKEATTAQTPPAARGVRLDVRA